MSQQQEPGNRRGSGWNNPRIMQQDMDSDPNRFQLLMPARFGCVLWG